MCSKKRGGNTALLESFSLSLSLSLSSGANQDTAVPTITVDHNTLGLKNIYSVPTCNYISLTEIHKEVIEKQTVQYSPYISISYAEYISKSSQYTAQKICNLML